jgi:hypothetical protein
MSTLAQPRRHSNHISRGSGCWRKACVQGGTVELATVSFRSNALYALPLGVEQHPVASAVSLVGALTRACHVTRRFAESTRCANGRTELLSRLQSALKK